MPEQGARPEAAYRLIHDELLLDGSSRLNLATFVTTWMEPEADKLMAEAFDKNVIDKDEYPEAAFPTRRGAEPSYPGATRVRTRRGDVLPPRRS